MIASGCHAVAHHSPATSEARLEALNRYEQACHHLALEYQGDWLSAAAHLFKQERLTRQGENP